MLPDESMGQTSLSLCNCEFKQKVVSMPMSSHINALSLRKR